MVKNSCLLVPAGLHQTYLQQLLAMHQQVEKMEAQARRSIWWPFITRNIKNITKSLFTLSREAAEPSAGAATHT
jgi:hypothetical protein